MIDRYIELRDAKRVKILATDALGNYVACRRKFNVDSGLEEASQLTHFSLSGLQERKKALQGEMVVIDAIVADCAVAPKIGAL